jgi:hypothetical protein
MNDCGAKSKLSAPLIDLSKTGNYSLVQGKCRENTHAPRLLQSRTLERAETDG